MNQEIEKAYKVALAARENAHAPYSKFLVGSAIKVKGHDEIFPGCNVENASYGATICAERNSLIGAVARLGKIEVEYVVVACDTKPVTVPCALCLQVLSEFAKPETPIHLGDLESVKKTVLFGDLLPMPFNTLDC
ncbi:cytidine deaminase [Halobacteriovorax marinus]|uniref:Cytidine deaminase n=1 Tax=Halobacteriovorax marinus (strain ATCC BAA-682 / DSM 15412 / SJ) TaxID=862908 RepID=E1X665_HALMS|nr:cytidine deaminase [Halobacteriovorax marinus]ATH08711.1 cytidine deaminase [Halobacteriovorax marinus]CBW27410.1 cytidine deaminase [Halobacteriovorax marinus SJ]